MLGYWNDAEKTAGAIDAARWMHTGDLATMDEEGYLNIVGRIKDMVIRGGVPDQRFGEEIMAWIKLKEGESCTVEAIKDFCKGQIAHFKVPRYIKFVAEFPMTVTGKIRKVEMREVSIRELGLEGAAGVRTA